MCFIMIRGAWLSRLIGMHSPRMSQSGVTSLVCGFQELYRAYVDDFAVGYLQNVKDETPSQKLGFEHNAQG